MRANTTTATPLAAKTTTPAEYRCSDTRVLLPPMSDGFLVLAQAPGGLTCFLLPRWRPDGSKNALQLVRLKDKLGDWSNASSEVEFHGAWARRVGDEGRGIATILEMVMLTRLDCMLGSAGLMRMALAQAIHHCRHRRAFGKRLVDHPLMRNVLADLAIESEAALALSMRVARAVRCRATRRYDETGKKPRSRASHRDRQVLDLQARAARQRSAGMPRRQRYVEESLLPRLYRQAPLNSIWEGSGNIQCLDVLRALQREPETSAALLAELDAAAGLHAALDDEIASLRHVLRDPGDAQAGARFLVERMALALQASVLLRAACPAADTFCRSRLTGQHGLAFGTLPADVDFGAAIDRAFAA